MKGVLHSMENTSTYFQFKDSAIRKFVFEVLRISANLLVEFDIRNLERANYDGGVIFAANHLSAYDAIMMQLVIPRTLCFMSKAELFQNPLGAWFFNRLGSFPVKRGEFDRQAILHARKVLESGMALMMFPEGTRTYGKGMVAARTGTAHFAMRTKCPILPVALDGSERILKNGLRKTKVRITFCKAILPDEQENAGDLTERMMHAIAVELPAGLRGVYS